MEEEDTTEIPVPQTGDDVSSSSQPTEVDPAYVTSTSQPTEVDPVYVTSTSQPTEIDPVYATSAESLPEEATDTSDEEADEEEVDVEICESVDSYYFRVPVPGVERAAGRFSCEIEKDGTITIHGYMKDRNKTIQKNSDEGTIYVQSDEHFKPIGETIFKPGPFKHSFHLPGPVDPRKFTGHFSDDGIFEAFVMKNKAAD